MQLLYAAQLYKMAYAIGRWAYMRNTQRIEICAPPCLGMIMSLLAPQQHATLGACLALDLRHMLCGSEKHIKTYPAPLSDNEPENDQKYGCASPAAWADHIQIRSGALQASLVLREPWYSKVWQHARRQGLSGRLRTSALPCIPRHASRTIPRSSEHSFRPCGGQSRA